MELDGTTEGRLVLEDKACESVDDGLAVAELGSMVDVVLVVGDRRNVDGALFDHGAKGVVIDVYGVFDGVGAGADRVSRAIRTVGVDGDAFAGAVGDIGRSFHLLVAIGLEP